VPLIIQYSYLKCSKHEVLLNGDVKFSPSFGIMVARWNCTSSITTERSSCELPCSLANVFHTRVCEAKQVQTVSLYSLLIYLRLPQINTGLQIKYLFHSIDNWQNAKYIMQIYFNFNILLIADFIIKQKILEIIG